MTVVNRAALGGTYPVEWGRPPGDADSEVRAQWVAANVRALLARRRNQPSTDGGPISGRVALSQLQQILDRDALHRELRLELMRRSPEGY